MGWSTHNMAAVASYSCNLGIANLGQLYRVASMTAAKPPTRQRARGALARLRYRRTDCIIPRGQLRGYLTGNAWTISHTDCQFVLVCPLPINNVELGGTTTDNDISKFRVHFRDPTPGSQVITRLIKSQVSGGTFISSSVCGGLTSAATTTPTTTIVSCPHDVAGAGAFYHFELILMGAGTSSFETPSFYGIDFP